MKQLLGIGRFVRRLRTKLRYGKLSRASLQLLELRLRGTAAECDWMARPPDAWDADLPLRERERNAASQALEDAIAVRELLFAVLPEVQTADYHVYRSYSSGQTELIITGTVTKEHQASSEVRSLAMRAKLCGFHFVLNDGILEALEFQNADQAGEG
jgi:hypothetical protein